MKILSINIELSQLALEIGNTIVLPKEFLNQTRQTLASSISQLGIFIKCQLSEKRSIGRDLDIESYDLEYEHKTLRLKFICFQPRGTWEMQGFQWVV